MLKRIESEWTFLVCYVQANLLDKYYHYIFVHRYITNIIKIATRTARFRCHFLRLNFTHYMVRIGNWWGIFGIGKEFSDFKKYISKIA